MNKVTFGLRNVHVAFFTDEVTPTWDVPVAIPGAVRLTPSAVGSTDTFYADDTKYFTVTTNNGYDLEISMASIPDTILAQMLGWEIDTNGMLVEIQDAQPAPFALLGEVQGDSKNRRFVYYHCTANRPAKEKQTKAETTTPQPDVLTMASKPIDLGGKRIVKGDLELSETNTTAFDGFYDAVYTPTFA